MLVLSYVLVVGSEADESACVSFWHHAIFSEFEPDAKSEPEWWHWVTRAESYRGGHSEGVAHIAAVESAPNALAGGQRAVEFAVECALQRTSDGNEWRGESAVHAECECLHSAATEPRERRHVTDGVHAERELFQLLVQLALPRGSIATATATGDHDVQHARELHVRLFFQFECERPSRSSSWRNCVPEDVRQHTASARESAGGREQWQCVHLTACERCAHRECSESRHRSLPDVALRGALHSEGFPLSRQ